MNEFITKLIERLKEQKKFHIEKESPFLEQKILTFNEAIIIVKELAEEYKADTNDCYNDFISRSVLIDKLQKWKSANEERGYDTAKDLVQEMIDLVKEQPSAHSRPPVSSNIPTWKQNLLQKFERVD